MSTPTVTQTFQHLHRVRKHLRELKSEIDLGPRVMAIQQQKLDNEKQAHKDAHDIIGKMKLKIRDDEGTLKQLNTQLAKFEKQLNDAGSPKEYEGKQSEIRQAKEKIAATEEAILAGMEIPFESRLPADRLRLGMRDHRTLVDPVRNVVQPASIGAAEVHLQKRGSSSRQFGDSDDTKRCKLCSRFGADTVNFLDG